jgi:peptide-methionine (S)-S-oxide reductase
MLPWILLLGMEAAAVAALRPTVADTSGTGHRPAVLVLAGGCYWGVESVFHHVRGVESAVSGYGTPAGTASAGPAEAVRVTYDPAQISFRQILDVFFLVVHDPTQLNRQGPDVGPEYRSLVFATNDRERSTVRGYIDSLSAAHVFPRPIVTGIVALRSFRPVDDSQQDYAARHPTDPYIVINDVPKLAALRRRLPRLYRN